MVRYDFKIKQSLDEEMSDIGRPERIHWVRSHHLISFAITRLRIMGPNPIKLHTEQMRTNLINSYKYLSCHPPTRIPRR